MNITLDSKRLNVAFIVTLFFTIAIPSILPSIRLTFFAPFLIILCYQKSFQTCLWLAFLCGLIIDLLSSYTRLGLYSLDYCLTISLLYPQRRNFFSDSLSTLPIMTFLFASLSTLFMAILQYSIEMRSVFSWKWVQTDLLAMPLADSFYALTVFILPALLLGKRQRKGKDYFI